MLDQPRRLQAEAIAQIDALLGTLDLAEPARLEVMKIVRTHVPVSPSPSAPRGPRTLGEIARLFHKLSVQRNEMIGAPVTRDDRWNMLLDLFAAAEEGRPISVSSLAIGAASPATTALRHIDGLFKSGLIERVADPDDRRRTWVRLAPETHARMAKAIRGFIITEQVGPKT